MSFRTLLALFGCVALVAGGFAVYVALQAPGPLLVIEGPKAIGGASFELEVSVDADRDVLSSLDARLEQQGRRLTVLTPASVAGEHVTPRTGGRVTLRHTVPASALAGIVDGKARLIVTASKPILFGLKRARTVETQDIVVRLAPPALSVVSSHHYITLGGSEMVVYRVSPPGSESGVSVGDRFYRGYPAAGVSGGRIADPGLHVAFFALSFDDDVKVPIRLVARDAAGNSTVTDFPHRSFEASFSRSKVSIDDRLLNRVVPAVIQNTPGLDLARASAEERERAFLFINRDLRRRNAEQLARLSADTSPEWLARGAFTRLAGSKSEAPFAEHRTYVVGNREIDHQVHLGFDLASTRGAPVAASNTGRVVFAAYLGIYGNCVVLDHGMGVQTLYGHLSALDVEKGDRVGAGETIGRSGATGMAGGDHVHFTVLVGGTPVTPIEWWDPHWIQDRIERKLTEAGIR